MSEIFTPRNDLGFLTENSSMFSRRDPGSLNKQWQQVNKSLSRNASVTNKVSQLNVQLQRYKRAGFSVSTENYFPFKVYQPTQASLQTQPGTTYTATTFDQTGKPIMVVIDSNNPTDETANPPTYNPNTDYWRFWFVRDGIVEVRPYYSTLINEGFLTDVISINNFALQLDVLQGTDQINNPYDDPITGTPSEGYFTSEQEYGGVIIIPGGFGEEESVNWSFWIEITPDQLVDGSPTGLPTTQIKGRRFSGEIGDPYFGSNIPAQSPFIIPIALLLGGGGQVPFIEQLTYNNVVNRYQTGVTTMVPSGSGATSVAPPTSAQLYTSHQIGSRNYRGNWQNDPAIQTMAFYPGDEVTFAGTDIVIGVGTDSFADFSVQEVYVCIQNCILVEGTDPSENENFVLIATSLSNVTEAS